MMIMWSKNVCRLDYYFPQTLFQAADADARNNIFQRGGSGSV